MQLPRQREKQNEACHRMPLVCVYQYMLPIVLVVAGYIVLMKWVLPRLGVPT